MKVKSVFAIISCIIALAFVSCNDDLNPIGGTIQPPGDGISTVADTLPIIARTVATDSIYARTMNGILGKYEDELFGTIKSDYICQYYFPEGAKFQDNVESIDSVFFAIDFKNFSGDTLAPMGLSVYEVASKLPENFYTNVDPVKYIGTNPRLLAGGAYTIAGASKTISEGSILGRTIHADMGVKFGEKIHNAWKDKTFTDSKTFNDFFKGTYVTTNFGSGSLIQVLYTSIDIYYKYNHVLGNYNQTKDTIRTAMFSLTVTPEVLQLNSIKNKNPEALFNSKDATYLKTPAGVYTEVVFPIKQIKANMKEAKVNTLNTALFSIKGYTEKESEDKYELGKPNNLLLINKDSIETFFSQRLPYNGKTNILGKRGSNNIYNFSNIAMLINTYKDMNLDKDPTFAIIPVEVTTIQNGQSSYLKVLNYMKPATSIIRNDPSKNMRLELIYSEF